MYSKCTDGHDEMSETRRLQERQQLSVLETERRAALRLHEDELAAEAQRLEDCAKEQRLRQLESMEAAYQTQLQVPTPPCTVNALASFVCWHQCWCCYPLV